MTKTATARLAKIHDEVDDTAITENGFDFPDDPSRYLVIMRTMGDRIWAINCETLDECAQAINEDDTDREETLILDLDTDAELVPVLEVVKIMGAEGGDWTRPAPPIIIEVSGGCAYAQEGANVLIVDYDNIADSENDEDIDADVREWLKAHNPAVLPSNRHCVPDAYSGPSSPH